MTVFPGARTFFLGNTSLVSKWERLRLESQENSSSAGVVVKSTFNWALDQLDGTGTVGSYDAARHPIVLLNFVGQIQILIADPDVLKDMFSVKNQLVDKTDMLRIMFKNFYGDSFLFSKTDEHWKAKRKATAHAFYRERMVNMLEVLKQKIREACDKWAA